MAPIMYRLALLSSLATTSLVHAHSFRLSGAGRYSNELELGGITPEVAGPRAGQDLRARADAKLCGIVDGEDYECPQGQVCSVDHDSRAIGCCPRSDPQCGISSSCKGFGGDSFFFKRAHGDGAKPVTCSGFFQNSCVTYSYVGGPYNGYHMYSCDAFSSQHDISMSVPLEADPEPPKSSITSTTTRPRPTATQTTRTSTRAPATTQTTTKDSNISSSRVISTTMTAGSSTAVGLSTTATSSDSASATGTEGAAVLTSTPSPAAATAPAAAADGSTVPQASNTGAIVGGVLGGLAAIALVVAVCLYFMWYRKKREEENTYLPAMGYTNDSAFYSQPPLGTSRQQAPAAGGARTSHGGYNSIRSSNDAARARGMGSAGFGVGAAAGIGAAAGASRHQQQRSFSSRHDPGSAAYGKTMDDTAISPVDPTDRSISPPDSPNHSPARPVSPPQAYNRFNPPPPEHFRAYKPYEGT